MSIRGASLNLKSVPFETPQPLGLIVPFDAPRPEAPAATPAPDSPELDQERRVVRMLKFSADSVRSAAQAADAGYDDEILPPEFFTKKAIP